VIVLEVRKQQATPQNVTVQKRLLSKEVAIVFPLQSDERVKN